MEYVHVQGVETLKFVDREALACQSTEVITDQQFSDLMSEWLTQISGPAVI